VIWTTTPWTLPANLAVCVGPDIEYALVRDLASGDHYLAAEARLNTTFRRESEYEVVWRRPGRELAGGTYEPLFPYFRTRAGAFTILVDRFVSTDEGTGIVHMAPAYGEDDYRVCREAGIDLVDPLDEDAVFTPQVPDFAGMHCKDADRAIIRSLKTSGKLVHQTTIVHSYPFCERTDTPLIYRAIEAWYVRVEDIRQRLLESNRGVRWMPGSVGEKRFGNWLAEAKDWNISRNRFWGSCIPVWINEDDPDDMICVGSAAELEDLSGERIEDLHKHTIDPIVIRRNGHVYRRTPEVLDCWFESGSMPYAQHHYPFENRERVEATFPADFIAEGLDQTRGWFYTLMVIGTALFGKAPFRNVIVNGLVLAEDGRKMSKRLQNYPDPMEVMNRYGADALRLCLLNSPVVKAEDLRFSEHAVREVMRTVIIPVWNAYAFLVTYARVDGWEPPADGGEPPSRLRNVLDRWILSQLQACTADIRESMEGYDLQKASTRFVGFIDDLTNWYIRRSRRRFWKSDNDDDKDQAYQTLHHVLLGFCKLAAPFIPFVTESIYGNLRTERMPESVHLCDYPAAAAERLDEALNRTMAHTMAAVSLGRHLRTQAAIRVRQPLPRVLLVSADSTIRGELQAMAAVVAEELNVKEVMVRADEEALVHLSAKANFRRLGPRLGPRMRAVATAVAGLDPETLSRLRRGEEMALDPGDGGPPVSVTEEDVVLQREEKQGLTAATNGEITVALDTTLSEDLVREGWARELVSRVQNLRKEAGLDVADRIVLRYSLPEPVLDAVRHFTEYIRTETLAVRLEEAELGPEHGVDLNGTPCRLAVSRTAAGSVEC
ncbi:MAG: isoleucine--tRNA ligase, partial [Lentisphaeria bacterium]|nr:isoleucine--tRNA ligase [Lentisphaeria bacterium]